ncbi:MAG TPA: S66 peptidase family protein [Thermoanaerobaculia bacterium]|nr:S66 peptidase family protein [Thermoanaerobaculia bacterium]
MKKGDTVGIVSPSWGGAGLFPDRLQHGVQCLRELGYGVRIAPHALNVRGIVSDTAPDRARDIHKMFADSTVQAIISAIGGDHSCHLLPYIDFELIGRNPKIFVGSSDITVLNVAIWKKTGLTTFNGPALLPDFAEWPRMFNYTKESFLRAVGQATPIGVVAPSTEFTDEYLDWGRGLDRERARILRPNPGWTWLREGRGEGPLIGGCLESLQHLRGTPYWPKWDGAVFFFESSGEPPETLDAILMDYENMGVWEEVSGVIAGRPYRYTDEQTRRFHDVLSERTRKYRFPVIADMDFGHTAPQFTIPIGSRARIDSASCGFEILEAAVREG